MQDVVRCVTTGSLFSIGKWRKGIGVEDAFIFRQNPARLSDSGKTLFFMQRFSVVPRREDSDRLKITTHAYEYAIAEEETRQELFAFHWSKELRDPVPYAHVHIGYATKDAVAPVSPKTHVPTGRVPVEDLVFFLIEELGIRSLNPDWRKVLEKARGAFMQHKSW